MLKALLKKFGICWKNTNDTVNNNMMTLRETIDHVVSRGAQAHIHACIYNVYYRLKDNTFPEIMESYGNVMKELESLPSKPDSNFHIVLQEAVTNDEEYVDVCIYNTVEDEHYAVDFIDWSDLIDLLIEDRIGLAQADQLAHVLYELTFWGFTEDQIKKEKNLLDLAAKETEQVTDILDIDDLLNSD